MIFFDFALKQLTRFLKYFLFWILYFITAKIIFLVYNLKQSANLSSVDILGIFRHGMIMDVATACYILVIPLCLTGFGAWLNATFVNRFVWYYTLFFISLASLVVVVDLSLYPHWGSRINVSVFNYLKDPVGLKASISVKNVLPGLLVTSTLVLCFMYVYRKILPLGIAISKPNWKLVIYCLLLAGSLIIPIRGGFDTYPINLSTVTFSPKLYANQAAYNYLWSFAKSIEKRNKLANPCVYMDDKTCNKVFDTYNQTDTIAYCPELLKANRNKKTNVILIILESFSNKVISSLGGLNGITPNLDSLCNHSTVFTSFYATGRRSDCGISALIGGYPSLLTTTVMHYLEKSNSLTLLPEYFNRKGYSTSFYYGGDINYHNLKAFILSGNYSRMVTESDFPEGLAKMSEWGVPDEYMLEKALADLSAEKQPFMQTIYTLSSHMPFDVPFLKIHGNSLDERYLNSIAYTDSCLGNFISEFRKSPLWENTLLIVTSDHGALQPGPIDITNMEMYRIPLIWSGGVINEPRRINTIAMQSDFPATLIHQLGWKTDRQKFSNDIFRLRTYAFFMVESGWGYITPEGNYYYDQHQKGFVSSPIYDGNPQDTQYPRAYMQLLHENFIKR